MQTASGMTSCGQADDENILRPISWARIVYIMKELSPGCKQSPLHGQSTDNNVSQRFSFLRIEALARQLGDSEPVEGFSARKLRNYYF